MGAESERNTEASLSEPHPELAAVDAAALELRAAWETDEWPDDPAEAPKVLVASEAAIVEPFADEAGSGVVRRPDFSESASLPSPVVVTSSPVLTSSPVAAIQNDAWRVREPSELNALQANEWKAELAPKSHAPLIVMAMIVGGFLVVAGLFIASQRDDSPAPTAIGSAPTATTAPSVAAPSVAAPSVAAPSVAALPAAITLRLHTNVDARVSIDGQPALGSSAEGLTQSLSVDGLDHVLTAEADGHRELRQAFRTDGGDLSLNLTLEAVRPTRPNRRARPARRVRARRTGTPRASRLASPSPMSSFTTANPY